MSDNPYAPIDDHQLWRDQFIEFLQRFRLFTGAQVVTAATTQSGQSGATTQEVLFEAEQLQYEYAAYGIKPDLTPSEKDQLALDLIEALELLDEDPGVLSPDQRDAIAQTLNAMLAEVSN
ncbi:MAG: hypothetical protein JJU33_13870 [Phycisphaerales bacterium]|nr:hypothetical protein [Phycisphaerales bacterium]